MASFLERWEGIVIRTIVVPQEQLRLRIPRESLNDYISLTKEYVSLIPAELIFDLDETGLSDWEERKTKPVIIPSLAFSSTHHYPIDRAIRHRTLLCCVSASGDTYSPLFIVPHPKAPRIFDRSIKENIDLKLEIRQVPEVDAKLFNQYIKEIFIPTVAANRELLGCANKPAILFCDNCASHCSEEILRELTRNGKLALVYPPHTSHFFQVLNVLFLGRLKVFKKYLPKDDNEEREIDHILKIFRAYEAVTTSMTIRPSWEKAGFSYYQKEGIFYFVVDEGRIQGAPGFCEIWERNYPIKSRSAQRRNQK